MSAVTQGAPGATSALTGLARALVQHGKLRPDRAETVARKAAQSNTSFIDELTDIGDSIHLPPSQVARFAADTFGHPLVDLAAFDVDQLPKDIIDKKLVAVAARAGAAQARQPAGDRGFGPDQLPGARPGQVPDPARPGRRRRRARQAAALHRGRVADGVAVAREAGRATRSTSTSCSTRPPSSRSRNPPTPRSTMRRSSASCRSCCWTRSPKAPRTCTSSRTRSSIASASASTACCARSRSRRSRSRNASSRASRCSRVSTSRRSAYRRTAA